MESIGPMLVEPSAVEFDESELNEERKKSWKKNKSEGELFVKIVPSLEGSLPCADVGRLDAPVLRTRQIYLWLQLSGPNQPPLEKATPPPNSASTIAADCLSIRQSPLILSAQLAFSTNIRSRRSDASTKFGFGFDRLQELASKRYSAPAVDTWALPIYTKILRSYVGTKADSWSCNQAFA